MLLRAVQSCIYSLFLFLSSFLFFSEVSTKEPKMGVKRGMTDEEMARTERNRQRAILIRNEKVSKMSAKE
jgi:hypothetical protein